jgi:hypothetical protein
VIETARSCALPKSVLAKACNYTLTLWTRLTRFWNIRSWSLGSILPGLAGFPINRIAELTPSAWAAPKLTVELGDGVTRVVSKTDTKIEVMNLKGATRVAPNNSQGHNHRPKRKTHRRPVYD